MVCPLPPADPRTGSTERGSLLSAFADLRARRRTSVELTEELLEIASRTSDLGAFAVIDAPRVRKAARLADTSDTQGPLHGLPLVIKDNIHVAGLPNCAGTAALRNFVPDSDAECVRRLRRAGAIIIGKTRLHELAFGATSDTSGDGPIRNAVDPRFCAGGSSGGTAVAVAAGAALAGLGTDTGGSVRIPCALNGIVGFRPTTGRYPTEGVTPLSRTRDTVGPMTRTVADAALLDQILAEDASPSADHPVGDLRIGVADTYFTQPLDAATAQLWQRALEQLAGAGIPLVPVPMTEFEGVETSIGMPITLYEARRELAEYVRLSVGISLTELIDGVTSDDVRAIMESAVADDAPQLISDDRYRQAQRGRRQLQRRYADIFAGSAVDAIVFPTTPLPASMLPVGPEVAIDGDQYPTFLSYIRNTGPGTLAGLPGLTVPTGHTSDHLPVGLALDGPVGSDRRLLAVGAAVEKILTAANQ